MLPIRPFRTVKWLPFLAVPLLALVQAGARASEGPERPVFVPDTADGLIPVFLETTSADAVAGRVEELGGRVEHIFRAIDGLCGALPAAAYEEIAADPRVRSVQRQRYVQRAALPVDRSRFEEAGIRVAREAKGYFVSTPSDRFTVRQVDPAAVARGDEPISFIGYEAITRAHEVRAIAGFGEHTTTAIIDTGVYPDHPMYAGNVVGGINLVPADEEKAIDFDGNGTPDGRSFPWHSVRNDPHGTFVAGLVAGHVDLAFPASDSFVQAVNRYSPESVRFDGVGGATVRLFGTAPGTDLFAVKVFPYDGGPAPDVRVAVAIDRLITMDATGNQPIDVINMSLSGPVLFDGFNPLDAMVAAATANGITCVSAASNDGPALVTVGSPASAIGGLVVGAAVDPIHTRAAVEDLFGAPPGAGQTFYPEDVVRIAEFSSRGVTGDNRVKPDLVATGFLVYSSTLEDVTGDGLPDQPGFGWSFGGTSFSTPLVSGAAAVVTSYAHQRGSFGRAPFVGNVLERAAVPVFGFHRVSQREQGFGYVSLPQAINLIRNAHIWPPTENRRHLNQRHHDLAQGALSASFPELIPGQTFTFHLQVHRGTKRIDFTFPEVQKRPNQNPFFGDQLAVAIHSAKRGGTGDYVFRRGSLAPGTTFTYEDPEPGTVRVTFAAAVSNYSPVAGSLRAEPSTEFFPARATFDGVIRRNGSTRHGLDVPAGFTELGVMLSWVHDWTTFPTFDLDLVIEAPDGSQIALSSLDSPELVWVEDPQAGRWKFLVHERGTANVEERYVLKIAYGTPARGEGELALARPRLLGASPNPFTPATEVRFSIPARGDVALRVYDVAGRLVRTLVDEPLDAGAHAIRWDGRTDPGKQAAAGVYFLRLETAEGTANRKVVRLE
jgi:subtilisin family serine protease